MLKIGFRRVQIIDQCSLEHDDQRLRQWCASVLSVKAPLLPVYLAIDSQQLEYTRFNLPRLMNHKAIQHYIKRSLGDLLGGSVTSVTYDYAIQVTSNKLFDVHLYGVDNDLYHYCHNLAKQLGCLTYAGPSDWVKHQFLKRYLPLQPRKGYAFEQDGWQYYWFEDSKGDAHLKQTCSQINAYTLDHTINWQNLSFNQPYPLNLLWNDPQPNLAALSASM